MFGSPTILNPTAGGLVTTVTGLTSFVLSLVGFLAIGMFFWAGYYFLTAGGEEAKIAKGRKTLFWSFAGLALIILSESLVKGYIAILSPAGGTPTTTGLLNSIFDGYIVPLFSGLVLVVILYSGTLFIMANGDSAKVKKARNVLLWGILTVIMIVLATGIINWYGAFLRSL